MANTRQTQAATTTRDSDFISGCPGRTHGTLFEIAGNRSTRATTLGGPWIRFALPAMVEARTRSDSPAGFSGPALRQNKRETDRPELGSAAALSVSVSRHLVSTSVQFGQSAAGKTESDQWPLAAHLLSEQLRNLRSLRHLCAIRRMGVVCTGPS
jgi:hypothetical protein